MICVDTSVVVAAVAPWHEFHERSAPIIVERPHLPAHALMEVYATLTRLPAPFRMAASVVADYLHEQFADRVLHPDPATVAELPTRLAALHLTGGMTYDALIAATAAAAGATLHTLDLRATRVYDALTVDYVRV